ncbi:class I SAM-dependent methyltransferase [Nocardiopsis sp. MG754419]|uniref:class I SAM-dependent methyltransferase n=1 Tax=Nocardiopsis sp. MG754419 TaxID=2259865 RepID=UPI001BAA1A67|nr:class I SAM-dependent methyltransferase [Nocardiopsis sp. MG754419]MBR8742587.1 class I SAM-dependent methyltransferase [Nocardiopsis sp. MG754419]
MTPDALTGWDEETTAEAYAAFARAWPMYGDTSHDLARRAGLVDGRLVVDLCGGTGVTAGAILERVPAHARVLSLDNAAAMQRIGRRTLRDPRLSWVTASAETLAAHVPARGVDAVVCNSGLWKTDVPAVAAAVRRVLRPGGRFVFNIGGGFAGLTDPNVSAGRAGPSLDALIHQIAARDHGYSPSPRTGSGPKLPLATVTRHLSEAGLTVTGTVVKDQLTTVAERKAWLSIPVFARPDGDFTHAQRMRMLEEASARTDPDATTVTRWLVVTAQRRAKAR